MDFDLKWVHMARYELISRQDGAIWLTIIFQIKEILRSARGLDLGEVKIQAPLVKS